MTGKVLLYGDYELLIDECLAGDKHLKRKIAKADCQQRGGLSILLNALQNRAAQLSPFHDRLVGQLKQDHDYWLQRQADTRNITVRKNGRYQAKVTVEYNRYSATFETLEDAQSWRDRMLILGGQIIGQ